MIILPLALALVIGEAKATTPIPAQAEQANATAATRLAAEAHAKALKAIRVGASNRAELEKMAERMAFLECHAAQADKHIAEIRAAVDDLDARLARLEHRVSAVESHQVALIVGAGESTWIGPEISNVYYGTTIPYVALEVGFASEDRKSGWTLMGTGEYNPGLVSPGGGGYLAVYAKHPFGAKRLALGGYAGGDYRVFDQTAQYTGYKADADAGLWFRFTADKPRDGFGAFVTVRVGAYYGTAADYTGASAPEFGGLLAATVQGGKFWRF